MGYEELLRTPVPVVESLHEFLSREGGYDLRIPPYRELSSSLDRNLHRQRADEAELSAHATPSQVAFYEFLRNASTGSLPHDPSSDCIATLREYEATVDLARRERRAEEGRERRAPSNLELQLAIRGVELRHAVASRDDAIERGNTLSRRLDRAQEERHGQTARLAVAEARVARFTKEQEGLRRAVTERDALQRHKQAAAKASAAAHAEKAAVLRQWDAEILRRRDQIADVDQFIDHLQSGIHEWLGSRRWRLGDALATLPHRLTLRRSPTPAIATLQTAVGAHHAVKATNRQAAKSQVQLLGELPAATSVAAQIANAAIRAESTREAALNRKLLDRAASLAKSAADIAERQRFADELIALVEILHASRRWRLGHALLSIPHRLLGRPAPPTAADFLMGLIRNRHRSASMATPVRPAAPAPVVGEGEPTPQTIQPPGTESAPLFPPVVSGDVDIVVCVHNALEDVERCLVSVLARTTVTYRLIVVNDGSDESTTERLRALAKAHDVIDLIETNGPLGYTRAANQGLRASTAPNVVLLNSDTIVPRLWVEDMLECMASGDDVGIVGPLSNAASWQSVPKRTGPDGGWTVNDLPPGYNTDEFAELLRLAAKRRFPRVDFVNGFCLMIGRRVIEHIGYLDEASFPRGYGEEDDYCIRARDAGFELAVADQCFVYHAKSKSFGGAARDKLAQLGGETLERKYGKTRLDEDAQRMKNSMALAEIRAAVRSRLASAREPQDNAPHRGTLTGCHVLFVLPVRGGSGGANSVIQEAAGMRSLGVDAKVATHIRYADAFKRFYPEFLETGDLFVFYDTDSELMRQAAPFQVVVATLWSTPSLIAPIAVRWPSKLYAYYVQDYEPWFFADDDESRAIATDSYTLIPHMVLMAKTDWICRTVQELHDRPVYRVAPSLDHEVFHPDTRSSGDRSVTIAAMVRPTTPRRAPLRTIRVLKEVAAACPDVRVLLFGCEPEYLQTYIARNAPELELDDHFENRGILARQEVADLLRDSDIFADLSDYQAFGRSGLEAMACGCAVVLPKNGGVYEYAVHGENSLVVDTKSDEEMAQAICTLVTNPALRTEIAQRAIKTAARFDITRASVSELAVFRAAVAVRDRQGPLPAAFHSRGVMAAQTDAVSAKRVHNGAPRARRAT